MRSAVIGLGILFFGYAAEVQAQSALETVAFIVLGADKNHARPPRFETKGNLLSITDTSFQFTENVEQINNCKYRIFGTSFFNDVRAPVDYTIDFTDMSPDGTVGRAQEQNSRFSNEWFFVKVPGVRVCAKESHPNVAFAREPRPGQCRNYLETNGYVGGTKSDLDRTWTAVKYFKATFCKGSAF